MSTILLGTLQDLNPLFQLLTLVALVVYVWKTWAMASATEKSAAASHAALQEMRVARETESKPYIICHFAPDKSGRNVDLVVRNSGRSIAFDVSLEIQPPVARIDTSDPDGRNYLRKKEFVAMPPDFEWRWRAGSMVGPNENIHTEAFTASISYKWGANRVADKYELTFDARSLRGGRFENRKLPIEFLESIADSLQELVTLASERLPKPRKQT